MMSVEEIIKERVKHEGPISFRDFMEMALYYPGLGYYTASRSRIGKNGDYYTSPCLGSLFGALIGKQIEEMWRLSGERDFTVVEYGAGSGALCNDILSYLKENSEIYYKLRYAIIERNAQKKFSAAGNEKVHCCASLDDIGMFNGCVLSNELLDNFSVHQVVMEEELMEVFVDYDNGFKELLKPASEELRNYFAALDVSLPQGFRTEVNLQSEEWLHGISDHLHKGFVLTIDYGFHSSELYQDKRRQGTIVCYHQHKVNIDPYAHIGDQDITAHVNFSALEHYGACNGLECCGYTDQGSFLRSLGLTSYLRKLELSGQFKAVDTRDQLFLLHNLLMDLGRKIKVLIQSKGMKGKKLMGLSLS